ncbi:DsbA family protein [Pacificibacter marinus]|uniref:Disulfide bond formation protein D n=1 Tax=Pacificibacter marinus TaxID=658057 RepID=A0A1Y5RWX0_9RHOB|nr:DsbA family protein [Pacificibacter marinus]SEK42206.1 Protein-disulfide isomerase [Pacificibacter marinus]SLN24411.1 Disulfide bond formation protein D precursor [Pacificibacter marinus]
MRVTRSLLTLGASALVALSTTGAAWSSDLANLSDTDRKAFQAEVRAYLLDNPEVLMEAIAVLETRNAQQVEATDRDLISANAVALFESPSDLILGNPDGDITMVEFLDYRCGYCKKAHPDVNALLENDGNIKLIVKEFPILGEASVLASRFAIATHLVAGNAAYAEVHEALMTAGNNVSEASLKRLVRKMDFDVDAVMAKMNSDEVTQIIAQNHALGQAMQINGTPAFVMQSELIRGYVPYDSMVEIVADLRAKG